MALPSPSDVKAMNIPFNGEPFIRLSSSATKGMEVPFSGEPFIDTTYNSTPPTTDPKQAAWFAMF